MSAYNVTAQFYDLMAGSERASIELEICAALQNLKTEGAPVIDIGAGTGLSTQVIAKTLPETEILAIEPDPAMRAILIARTWSDPDLRQRVSILPQELSAAHLPSIISGAVASASLVHFDPQQRRELWALLSKRLSPTGVAVIEIQCPIAQDLTEFQVATAKIGQVVYEGWASAQRVSEDRLHWKVTYVSRFHGKEFDRQSTDYDCWTISSEQLLSEAADFGLKGISTGSVVVLSKEISRN